MMIFMLFSLNSQAYANNQHRIEEEILTNPFLKAMSICEGTVSILDAGCVVYSRIWCIFEIFKSVMGGNSDYEFDVYTEIDGGKRAVGITHGYIRRDCEMSSIKIRRESEFPLDRILQAMNVDVKQAQASVESDRQFILNTITGRSVNESILDNHSNYDKLNNILRGIFVSPALQRIIEERDVDTITRCLDIVKVSNAKFIHLALRDCSSFDDDILIKLADSLPPTLTKFSLTSLGSAVTVHGMNACLGKILGCPQLVELDLSFNNIGDNGAEQIADALKENHHLKGLNLWGNNIGADGAKQITDALKVNNILKTLDLSYNNIGDDGANQIADALKGNHSLDSLMLNSNNIGNYGAKKLADALKVNNSLKTLDLMKNNIGDDGARKIADVLRVNHTLETLYLMKNKICTDGEEYLTKLKLELNDVFRDIRWV